MRTTVNIDDRLLAQAKRRALEAGSNLSAVVDGALRSAFATPADDEHEPPEVTIFHGGTGPAPGIDLTSNSQMAETIDDELTIDSLR